MSVARDEDVAVKLSAGTDRYLVLAGCICVLPVNERQTLGVPPGHHLVAVAHADPELAHGHYLGQGHESAMDLLADLLFRIGSILITVSTDHMYVTGQSPNRL